MLDVVLMFDEAAPHFQRCIIILFSHRSHCPKCSIILFTQYHTAWVQHYMFHTEDPTASGEASHYFNIVSHYPQSGITFLNTVSYYPKCGITLFKYGMLISEKRHHIVHTQYQTPAAHRSDALFLCCGITLLHALEHTAPHEESHC